MFAVVSASLVGPVRGTAYAVEVNYAKVVAHFAANTTGDRRAYIGLNGVAVPPIGRSINLANAASVTTTSRLVVCNGSTDYIEGMCLQSSGGNLDIVGGSDTETFQSWMFVYYLRPLP